MAAKAKNTKARGDATPAAELILEVLAPVAVELLWGEVEVVEALVCVELREVEVVVELELEPEPELESELPDVVVDVERVADEVTVDASLVEADETMLALPDVAVDATPELEGAGPPVIWNSSL
jgi:hypothetical protein